MNLPVNDGRLCPIDYQYQPADIAALQAAEAQTIYVIGGLYGNTHALSTILTMAAREPAPVRLIFNGDFNWFNRDPQTFTAINELVLKHTALRGNIETEIAREYFTGGCGCGYPDTVQDQTVEWSNEIIALLRQTANHFTRLQVTLRNLPRYLRFQIGDTTVAIVHGDCRSLAGWSLARENLQRNISSELRDDLLACQSDIVASTHTCEPFATTVAAGASEISVINNGAAGMPNLRQTRYGIITRIGLHPFAGNSLYRRQHNGTTIEALPVEYQHQQFLDEFLAQWPPASAAHASYFERINSGTNLNPEDACGRGFSV
jgi:predicted phosphodiesterase